MQRKHASLHLARTSATGERLNIPKASGQAVTVFFLGRPGLRGCGNSEADGWTGATVVSIPCLRASASSQATTSLIRHKSLPPNRSAGGKERPRCLRIRMPRGVVCRSSAKSSIVNNWSICISRYLQAVSPLTTGGNSLLKYA